jgi:hypothetical protein
MEEWVALIPGLIRDLSTCVVVWQCARFCALSYDRDRLDCDYYKSSWFWDAGVDFAMVIVGMVSAVLAAVVNPVMQQIVSGVLAALICFVLGPIMFSGWSERFHRQNRLLSARYMQHKYGLDESLLLPLLEKHQLPFPIVSYEGALKLSQADCDAYRASEEVQQRMRAEVEREFLDGVLHENAELIHNWRQRVAQTLHVAKMNKLKADWYAVKK